MNIEDNKQNKERNTMSKLSSKLTALSLCLFAVIPFKAMDAYISVNKKAYAADFSKTPPGVISKPGSGDVIGKAPVKTTSKKTSVKKTPVRDALSIQALKDIFNKMWMSDSVIMGLNKTVVYGLLGNEKKYSGRLLFSKGRLRVELSKPEPSLLLIEDEFIWFAQKLGKDLGSKWQITKVKKSMSKKSQALLSLLFGDQLGWQKLKVVKSTKVKKNVMQYEFVPKSPDSFPGVVKIKIKIDTKKTAMLEIVHEDEVENITTYKFTSVDFDKIIAKKKFKFRVPKGADVTVYE